MATLTKGKTFANGELVTPQKLHELVDLGMISGIVNADVSNSAAIALSKLATGALPTGITVASANIVDGTIVNADISASAAIADTKLATISTAGKVSNSATTATSANTANALVARDATGNFSAGTITAALSGNASSATTSAACSGNAATASKLATARTITLEGDLSGSVSFDGSANATLTAAVLDDSHNHVISNIDGLQTALDGKQAAGSYAPATGIAPSAITGTAVVTTDSRLSDARTPTAHTHGNITNAGAIGATANLPVVTTTSGVLTTVPAGTAGQVLTSNGGTSAPSFQTLAATSTNANNLTGGSAGTVPYQSAAGTTVMLAAGTSGQVLRSNGAAAPSWLTLGNSATLNTGTTSGTVATGDHTHTIANVTGLQTALDGKQAAGSYAASSHNHDASAITTGQLDNARTTATSLNTANTIVLRDSSKVIWADKVNASQVIPKGGSLIFNDTFGTDFQFLGNSNDDKLFLKASGIEILEIDNTNGYPIWKIKNDLGSLSKIGVFKTNPATALDVNGTVTANSFVTSSDYRLKTNLEPLTDAVARLLQIPVHRFNWLADPNGQKVDGFLAHEAQAIVPEAVTGAKDAVDAERNPIHQGIDQSKLVPLLVAAVQELAARVAALEPAK